MRWLFAAAGNDVERKKRTGTEKEEEKWHEVEKKQGDEDRDEARKTKEKKQKEEDPGALTLVLKTRRTWICSIMGSAQKDEVETGLSVLLH